MLTSEHGYFLHTDIILFSHRYSQMDTDFYHEDEYVLNTNCTNLTNIFLHTNEHGFYRAEDYIIYSPTDVR